MKKTVIENYRNALAILSKKPIKLWGLTLLTQLLAMLAGIFGILPIVYLPVSFALGVGLCGLYLKGYRGEEVETNDIFVGFKKFLHVVGGVGWMALWILIWGLIPVVGFVFAIIKAYEYRFTPYILLRMPETSATDALKKSQEMTKGLKAKMFWSEVFVILGFYVVCLVLMLFARIPYIGVLFGIILFLFYIVFIALAPIFLGLIGAGFYDGAEKALAPAEAEPVAAPVEPVAAPAEPVAAPAEPVAAPAEPEVAPAEEAAE